MHRLIELDNVEELLQNSQRFSGGNGLIENIGGLARSILKFNPLSVCEVFGYQMATALGVRVDRMQGFWTTGAVNAAGISARPGRIGIVVEYLDDWCYLVLDFVATYDSSGVARALILVAFFC